MTDEKLAMSRTVEDFLTYVEETKSKHTYKEYKIGLEKFSKSFGKSRNEILEMRRQDWVSGNLHQKKRFTREIEKFTISELYPHPYQNERENGKGAMRAHLKTNI